MKKTLFILSIFTVMTFSNANSQCAMCKRTAETDMQNKNKQSAGRSLNGGILYLLSVPYVIGAVGAIAWYKNRRKNN